MRWLVLSSTMLTAAGCVVPAPLATQDVPADTRPVIYHATPDFREGLIKPGIGSSDAFSFPFSFTVNAWDEDPTHTLYGRMYLQDSDGSFSRFFVDTTLSQDHTDPRLYSGTFQNTFCRALDANKAYLFYVYVSDGGFNNIPLQERSQDGTIVQLTPNIEAVGHYDFKSWLVQCQ